MFQEGFSIALTGLAFSAVFLIVLIILVKLTALTFGKASHNAGKMGIPPGFLPETAQTAGSYAALSPGTVKSTVDYRSIAVAIAAAKAHAGSKME